jgi:hypothetical protein
MTNMQSRDTPTAVELCLNEVCILDLVEAVDRRTRNEAALT